MRLLTTFLLLWVVSFAHSQDFNFDETRQVISKSEQAAHEKKLYKSSGVEALNNYNIVYHQCNWHVDPAIDSIYGRIKTQFKPLVSGFSSLQFDLAFAMQVDSVMYHGSAIQFSHTANDILEITFPQSILANTLDSVTVVYHGKPVSTGFGSWVQNTHNNTPIIWTLSEPYGAKDWWPCKQNLLDKIDSIDIVVTTPSANRVASNGLLHSSTIQGSKTRYEWRHRHPIAAYLVAIAVTNYVQYLDFAYPTNDTIEILNYVFPEDSANLVPQTALTGKMIELFDSLFIPYPFANEKYGHAQFMWGGAMEHQTMSFMGNYSWRIIVHELAHQWFGDHVTCGSWEDIWLNEGFASYLEDLYVEHFIPGYLHTYKLTRMDYITSVPDGSIFCDDTLTLNRIFNGRLSYDKGSYLVHMLRWQVGDSAFFAALRNYLNDPLLKAGFARTPDLQNHFEQVSGQNLSTFFDQWYYKQGHPSYEVLWLQDPLSTWVRVNQSQSHNSVSFFKMPIPVRFYGANQDTTVVLDHTFSGQDFYLNINFEIDSVVFDPDLWILSRNNAVAIGNPEFEATTLSVYPNPAKNTITVDGILDGKELNIFDVSGRLLFSRTISAEENKIELKISTLSSGSYILLLKTETGKQSIPFVVQE